MYRSDQVKMHILQLEAMHCTSRMLPSSAGRFLHSSGSCAVADFVGVPWALSVEQMTQPKSPSAVAAQEFADFSARGAHQSQYLQS